MQFELKLKGDTRTYPTNVIELLTNGIPCKITTEATLLTIIEKYEVEELEVKVKNKYYPLYNCYYKGLQDLWLVEGVENDA